MCLLQTEADGKLGVGEAAVWQVAAEVAAGLAFLHAAGVLHLDVKPGNVFADGTGNLKLGDFGLAVLRHQWVSGMSPCCHADPVMQAAPTPASWTPVSVHPKSSPDADRSGRKVTVTTWPPSSWLPTQRHPPRLTCSPSVRRAEARFLT